jgi:hypothetical protein
MTMLQGRWGRWLVAMALGCVPALSTAAVAPARAAAGGFTIAARVRLTSTSGTRTLAGGGPGAARLQLRGDRFAFTVGGASAVDRSVIVQPGEGYALAGVRDARAGTISLYVNGRRAATVAAPAGAPAGDLLPGRGRRGETASAARGAVSARAYGRALSPSAIAHLAAGGELAVDGRHLGATVRPTQFGEFVEEISHSVDGGLYAELIRNRDLKENDQSLKPSPHPPSGWSQVGSAGSVSLTRAHPLTAANPLSLQLSAPAHAKGGRIGAANGGWWGFPVRPSTTYQVSFFARADGPGTQAPLTVDLESSSGKVWAIATAGTPTGSWTRLTATLHTPSGIPSTLDNRFVVAASTAQLAGGSDQLAFVSVFPPTYDGLANGFRIDLMQRLAALHPGYLRLPGGNALEGRTIATHLDWKTTIGPIEDRPGHFDSAWTGYWSQDGMGLLEYLELAQELHAQPILTVWDGYAIDGSVIPRGQLAPYVVSANDEIQYAIGSTSTFWGHQRAVDGHPAPFPVHMVEVGNEDYFDASGSYGSYRYPAFYDGIHREFPQMRIIASQPVTSRPSYAVDKHLYRPKPERFAEFSHLFDSITPRQPKVLVSEYGSWDAKPTANLAAAVGEAAFLTGTIRDAGAVLGVSYAPTLVNVNAPEWPSSLIAFDGLHNWVSPSYWVLDMLRNNLGRRVVDTEVTGGTGTLFDVATESPGHTYLAVVNDGPAAAEMQVALTWLGAGATGGTATTLSGAPTAQNSLAHPNRVAPIRRPLPGSPGTRFAYRFPAESVTVLDLATPAAGASTVSARSPAAGASLR